MTAPSSVASPSSPELSGIKPPRSLDKLQLTAFSAGMIGDRIFRDAPALLLLLFMTNYLSIPPALAGTAIFIPKLLIIVVDPIVGTLSDRLATQAKRRALMLAGAVLASVSMLLFFHVPHFNSIEAQAAYMSLIVFIGFTGYSLFSVPYLMMAAEIATSDADRRTVMSWRVAFMAVGLSISAFAGGFMEAMGGGIAGYSIMSWVYGAICLATMLITIGAASKTRDGARVGQAAGLGEQVRLLRQSTRYQKLLLVGFLQKTAEGIGYGSFAYFCIYVVNHSLSAIGLVVLAATAGQIIAQPLWLKASTRYAPATLYTAGMLGWCANILLWFAMEGQSEWWLVPLGLQGGMAAGGFLMVTLSMLSKVMADHGASNQTNCEGVFSGLWLAAEKLAFALGALIVGVLLSAFGFVESANGASVDQTPTAILGIAITYCGVNILICLLSIAAVRRLATPEPIAAR